MSDIGEQRASRRIEREIGDAPSLGHVERSPRSRHEKNPLGKNNHKVRKRRHRDRKSARLVIVTWSAVFALIALAIVGGALGVWLHKETLRESDEQQERAAGGGNERKSASRFTSPTKEAAVAFVKRALQVRDPARVPEFIRTGQATPAAVAAFLEKMEAMDGPITKYQWLSSMDANDLLLDGVAVHMDASDKAHNRLAILTPDEKGKWKIDFEAFARIVKPSWPEILTSPIGQNNLVRILFAKDNYYNGPFLDESQWECYRMGSPDLTDDLLGYCQKNSPQGAAMKRIVDGGSNLSNGKGLYRATLEIRHVKNSDARQFEISRVLAEDWVLNSRPFDEPHD